MNNEYKNFVIESRGMSLGGMFFNFQGLYGDIYENPQVKEMFLEFVEHLIKNGEIRLAICGKFLSRTPGEQVDLFRQAWPQKYDRNIPELDIDNLWWLVAAPAGAVWIYPDGTEVWT